MQVQDTMSREMRQSRADELLGIVRANREGAMLLAAALDEIRQDRLFEVLGHKTFEAFTKVEMGVSRQRAYKIIQDSRKALAATVSGNDTQDTEPVPNAPEAAESVSTLVDNARHEPSTEVPTDSSIERVNPPTSQTAPALDGPKKGETLFEKQARLAASAPAEPYVPKAETRFLEMARNLHMELNRPETRLGVTQLARSAENGRQAANQLRAIMEIMSVLCEELDPAPVESLTV